MIVKLMHQQGQFREFKGTTPYEIFVPSKFISSSLSRDSEINALTGAVPKEFKGTTPYEIFVPSKFISSSLSRDSEINALTGAVPRV